MGNGNQCGGKPACKITNQDFERLSAPCTVATGHGFILICRQSLPLSLKRRF
jgi:hypothetical protein